VFRIQYFEVSDLMGVADSSRARRRRSDVRTGGPRRSPTTVARDAAVRGGQPQARHPPLAWDVYCRTWAGFVYVAFVIDCFSRAIVGWHAATVKDTAMVTTALKMALWRRDHTGHPVGSGLIHHSDAGSRYTSISFAETLVLEGIAASIGSVGDAYENAPVESTIGLFKTEVIAEGNPFHPGPCKSIEDVEYATMEWVDWFNRSRLHSRLGYVPPDEFEAAYYAHLSTPQPEPSPI
jgi:transposase InsO family protein